MDLPNPNAKPEPVKEEILQKPIPVAPAPKPTVLQTNNCRDEASGDDFLKLRKKMAAAATDDDMILVAKKVFKSKCFTTEQLKNLSVLFLTDKGRYDFFDASYAYVSDINNFSSLENQLTDTYFINRFRVMIRR